MAENVDHKYDFETLALAAGSIWAAVLAVSVFSPDMVSGSEQEHLHVAAFATWIWGLLATNFVFTAWMTARRSPEHLRLYRPFAIAVAVVWGTAAAVGIFVPEAVTGSDPTRIPFAAILAPIAAMIVTRVAAELLKTVVNEDRGAANGSPQPQ